jgi:ABC-2 type transport system ATP-binding protein
VWQELHRLRRDGRTIVVTTQYLNEAELCDHVGLIAEGRLVALAAPDDLRRLAIGGDVIEVETAGMFDGDLLKDLPVVRDVRQLGPRRLRITVDDVGAATPDLVAAVERHGGEVASAREERPSFDEVFSRLVAREEARRKGEGRPSGSANGRDRAHA